MIQEIFNFLSVAGESLNRILSRRWGTQTSAEAERAHAIDSLEREWKAATAIGDLARANAVRDDILRLLNKTIAEHSAK